MPQAGAPTHFWLAAPERLAAGALHEVAVGHGLALSHVFSRVDRLVSLAARFDRFHDDCRKNPERLAKALSQDHRRFQEDQTPSKTPQERENNARITRE